MPDQRNTDAKARQEPPVQDGETSNVVSGHFHGQTRAVVLNRTMMSQLKDAALSAERAACKSAVSNALASGISPEDLADHYIPELAREMGDQWCSNQMGFATVTIGVSRLQSMLRDLGPGWSGDTSADPDAPLIMLIVPQDVYHTLGAMVLGGQLRRKGMSVRLMLGARREELATQLRTTVYHAVFISSSIGETYESLRRIVNVIKTASRDCPPIVVGGTILDDDGGQDVAALTGADYATKIPEEALELCGLTDGLRIRCAGAEK